MVEITPAGRNYPVVRYVAYYLTFFTFFNRIRIQKTPKSGPETMVISVGRPLGRFVSGTFCQRDVLSLGPYVLGRFVCSPKKLPSTFR